MSSAKVAVSLPRELLDEVERARERTGESRSEIFRRAITALLTAARERADVERYVRAYREVPDDDEGAWGAASAAALAEEPRG